MEEKPKRSEAKQRELISVAILCLLMIPNAFAIKTWGTTDWLFVINSIVFFSFVIWATAAHKTGKEAANDLFVAVFFAYLPICMVFLDVF